MCRVKGRREAHPPLIGGGGRTSRWRGSSRPVKVPHPEHPLPTPPSHQSSTTVTPGYSTILQQDSLKMKIVVLFLVLGVELVLGQRRPPNYSQEQMPVTSFNCRNKIIGGYYADPETDCQMFHVCVKVPGHGVQDFKFLCPNDTSFDQENQICDDWFNIDCETSTLFYSDNFDLYRLGSEGSSRVKTGSVNNAVSDVEDGLYLQQKADRGEHVQNDLLRGSQSSNFFSNRGGRDEEADYGKEELYKPKKKTVNKTQVRKLVTNRRPVQQATPPPTTAEPTYRPQPSQRGLGNRNFRGQQVIRQQETTVQPSTQAYQQPARRDYFTARPTSTAAPPRPQYETQPTQRPDFYRTNHLPQTTRSQETFPPVETTPRPSWQTNNQRGSANYNNNNNQQTTQPQQFYNQQTSQKQAFYQGTTYRPNYFETTQRQQPTTQKPSFYNNFNIPAATTTLRPYYPSEFSTQTSATRRQQQQQQAYQTQPTTPQAPTTLHYQQDTNSNYETQKLYRINLGAAVGVQPPRYNAEQRSNDDDSADEFLTGAHSQNLAASAFNNRVNGEQKRTGYNTSVSAAYAFNTTPAPLPSKRTEKPRPFTTTQQPPQVKTQEGRHDPTAYDYAYYDDGTPSEYENVENVEEFSRTTARKRSA